MYYLVCHHVMPLPNTTTCTTHIQLLQVTTQIQRYVHIRVTSVGVRFFLTNNYDRRWFMTNTHNLQCHFLDNLYLKKPINDDINSASDYDVNLLFCEWSWRWERNVVSCFIIMHVFEKNVILNAKFHINHYWIWDWLTKLNACIRPR